VDTIEIDFGEIEWVDVGWVSLTQDRDKWKDLVNALMKRVQ
jgi:hypothetical protein